MSGRIPILPTVIVLLAVAAMIGLGIWQLDRRGEKEAMIRHYRANLSRPETAYPANAADDAYLFRRVKGHCLRVVEWRTKGGRLPNGSPGWRHIATCATGVEGPGLIVDIGMSADPKALPRWNGGDVRGTAVWEPSSVSAVQRWLGHKAPLRLMIVSGRGEAGLQPSTRPDPAELPNNHLAYAVQWFLFAAVALIIYGLALRNRARPENAPPA